MYSELSEEVLKDSRWSRALGTACTYATIALKLQTGEQLYMLTNHEGVGTGKLVNTKSDYEAKIRGLQACEIQFFAVRTEKIK